MQTPPGMRKTDGKIALRRGKVTAAMAVGAEGTAVLVRWGREDKDNDPSYIAFPEGAAVQIRDWTDTISLAVGDKVWLKHCGDSKLWEVIVAPGSPQTFVKIAGTPGATDGNPVYSTDCLFEGVVQQIDLTPVPTDFCGEQWEDVTGDDVWVLVMNRFRPKYMYKSERLPAWLVGTWDNGEEGGDRPLYVVRDEPRPVIVEVFDDSGSPVDDGITVEDTADCMFRGKIVSWDEDAADLCVDPFNVGPDCWLKIINNDSELVGAKRDWLSNGDRFVAIYLGEYDDGTDDLPLFGIRFEECQTGGACYIRSWGTTSYSAPSSTRVDITAAESTIAGAIFDASGAVANDKVQILGTGMYEVTLRGVVHGNWTPSAFGFESALFNIQPQLENSSGTPVSVTGDKLIEFSVWAFKGGTITDSNGDTFDLNGLSGTNCPWIPFAGTWHLWIGTLPGDRWLALRVGCSEDIELKYVEAGIRRIFNF